ncbi:MAG: hypothetical protein ABW026_00360 [Microvirga sp.]
MIAIMGLDRSGARGRVLPTLLKLALLACVGLALLAVAFVAFIVILPLMLAAGAGLTYYLRRQIRRARTRQAQAQSRAQSPAPADGVIDAEYTIVESRPLNRR